MPTFIQLFYCSNCKKNVSTFNGKNCKICGSSVKKTGWSVRFRVQNLGQTIHKRLSGFKTKQEANKAYIDFLHDFSAMAKASDLFDSLVENYFQNCQLENAESTLYEKRHIFSRFINPFFKGKNLNLLSKSDYITWQNQLWKQKNPKTKSPYSWRYLAKIRGNLFAFLSFCEDIYDIPNKLRYVKIPKNMSIVKTKNFWEIETFNNFISTVDNIFWNTLWSTFMFTGARFSEIRALSDDDVKDGQITINKSWCEKAEQKIKATKNCKIVCKQIPKVLQAKIERYKAWKSENGLSKNFLFGGDKPLAENTIRRKLSKDIAKSRQTTISPHGFRHSYVSLLIHLGIPTKVIAELIGDREKQVIETYSHLYKNAKNDAIHLLDKKLSETNLGKF